MPATWPHSATSDQFSYGAWISAQSARRRWPCSRAWTQDDSYLGYDLFLDGGKVQADLVNRLLDDSIRVETQQPLTLKAWHHVLVTYDGSRSAKGMRIYVDGVPAEAERSCPTRSAIPIKTPAAADRRRAAPAACSAG